MSNPDFDLQSIFRRGALATSLRELKRAKSAGQPSALFGPFEDLRAGSLYRSVTTHAAYQQAKTYAEALGFDDKRRRTQPALSATLAALESLTPDSDASQAGAVPAIEWFETYEDEPGCCAISKGETVASACPGSFIRILGAGFGPDPSDNVVSFGHTKASILQASETQLVVIVPVPGLLKSKEKARFDRGSLQVTVRTAGGSASADFEVTDFPDVDNSAFDHFLSATRRVLAKVSTKMAIQSRIIDQVQQADATGRIEFLLAQLPYLLAQSVQKLDLLPLPLTVIGTHQAEFRRIVNGMIGASRILADLEKAETGLDDPQTDLLRGSGWLETICEVQEVLHRAVLVLLWVLLVIVVLILVVLLIFAGLGPGGWVIDVLIIAALVAMPVWILDTICMIITVVEIVHLAYEAVDWLYRKITGHNILPPAGGGG